MVVVENQRFINRNNQNEVLSPFVHKAVFLHRSRVYTFRSDCFLEDGICPKYYPKSKWR